MVRKSAFQVSGFMGYPDVKSGLIFILAGVIYGIFSVHLYWPYLNFFEGEEYLFVFYPAAGSLGCFLLSRRWVRGFWASLFSGGLYGFGPYILSLGQYHPTAGVLSSFIPWFFLPASFFSHSRRWWLIGAVLTVIPFAAIPFFFGLASEYGLFPASIQSRLEFSELAGILAPLVMARRGITEFNLVGFYHVPLAALLMGLFMLYSGRRAGVIIIAGLGIIPAFCSSFLDVSPVIWLTIPVLCLSVITGVGIEGLCKASSSDRKWILAATGVMAALSIISLVLASRYFQVFAGLGAGYGRLFVQTAYMYILGAVSVLIIFFMARAKLRMGWLRLIILCTAMGLDIYRGSIFIAGRIF